MQKTKMKQKFNIKKEFSNLWIYVKSVKNFIYLSIAVFLVFSLIGFFVPAPEHISERILEYIKQIMEKTKDMSFPEITSFIFLNNLQSSFFSMIFGIVLGIYPVIAAVANGYLLGFVASMSVEKGGILVLWRIFPHGIFELPAIFISLGMGIKIGISFFEGFFKKKGIAARVRNVKKNLILSLKAFLYIVLPLLIIAAIIEGLLISFYG